MNQQAVTFDGKYESIQVTLDWVNLSKLAVTLD